MKKTVLTLIACTVAVTLSAQWTSSGTTISTTQNVGIGTNNPAYKLDVNGNVRAKALYLDNVESNYSRIYYPGLSLMIGSLNESILDCAFDIRPGAVASGTRQSIITMWQANTGNSFEKKIQLRTNGITYFNGGNVGIGTDTPQNKLDVVGTIRATEVKIETGWADFVFDKDYKLPTLKEVEAHISEHRHLPGIPSEAEVKENGVSLGEMQAKLLQKIEELTLYTIELNKTVKEQGELIQELKSKLE